MLDMPLSVALRTCREFSGLSKIQIAIQAGLTEKQIGDFEIGDARLAPDDLISLARAIRLAVAERCERLKRQRVRGLEKRRRAADRVREHERNEEAARLYNVRVRCLEKARATQALRRAAQVSLPEGIESAAPAVAAAS